MTPTTFSQRLTARPRRGTVVGMLLAGGVAAAVLVALAPAFRATPKVARLSIENPTMYLMNVDVADGQRHGWLDLGAFGRERSTTVQDITDQGARWIFRFSYGGVPAGELEVARTDLVAAGWKITIPVETGERLRAAGLRPSVF